ncbi:MAG: 50S ribosomal protein L11 methyltransferase [Armatimonadetes bacterium]|nr:50S ribosomal protein L11 methyltransferase [Armatimonadota bacterium]
MEEDEGSAPVVPRYLVLTLTVSPDAVEAAAALLHEAGTGGVIEEDGRGGTVRLRAYLPLAVAPDGVLEALRARLATLPGFGLGEAAPVLTTEEVAEEAWASAWKTHFRPFRVGRRVLIVPAWEEPDGRPGEVVIRLDPGMAFGSGLHASTRLCLVLLEERLRPGGTVADIGTGSGILAIAAAKLGAARVTAVDHDPVAVRVAAANVAQNGVADRVTVTAGHFLDPVVSPVDLVVANLTADILEEMARTIPSRLRPGGAVVASGIVEPAAGRVRDAFERAGLFVAEERAAEEWRALVARAS